VNQLTSRLATGWLAERRQRWPGCVNPRLLVTKMTAMDTRHPPVTDGEFRKPFRQRGLTAQQTRQDRIRDEARHTTDPVHLMRLFGITASTAMNYIYAAPPRTAVRCYAMSMNEPPEMLSAEANTYPAGSLPVVREIGRLRLRQAADSKPIRALRSLSFAGRTLPAAGAPRRWRTSEQAGYLPGRADFVTNGGVETEDDVQQRP